MAANKRRNTPLLSRRRVIALGAGAAVAAASPWWLRSTTLGQSDNAGFPQPNVLKSAGGQLAVTLTCVEGVVDMGAANPVRTYTYDNVVPGYTWELEPGDTLVVDLINNLPQVPAYAQLLDSYTSGEDLFRFLCASPLTDRLITLPPPRPHQSTNTNLHTHGLHVSPSGIADNVFLDIPPGGRQHYEIPLPSDHQGGLFWYHPHRHGSVTQQVRAGMAGAIIVRGDIDDVPEIRAAKEQVMVLQAIELSADFQLMDVIPAPTVNEAYFPRKQILYPVNGVMTPRITMYPGEVQRWRMLNAAEGKFMALHLEGHRMNAIAWDGLNLASPDPLDEVDVPAGGRVDVLIQAGEPGTYHLILTPSSSARLSKPFDSSEPAEFQTRSILTVEVSGSGPSMRLPDSLPVFDPPILPIARTRYFEYTVQRHPDDTSSRLVLTAFRSTLSGLRIRCASGRPKSGRWQTRTTTSFRGTRMVCIFTRTR
jgi:FtsP/CotA-like multicopper oxidase with cupredoxin domain